MKFKLMNVRTLCLCDDDFDRERLRGDLRVWSERERLRRGLCFSVLGCVDDFDREQRLPSGDLCIGFDRERLCRDLFLFLR